MDELTLGASALWLLPSLGPGPFLLPPPASPDPAARFSSQVSSGAAHARVLTQIAKGCEKFTKLGSQGPELSPDSATSLPCDFEQVI